MVTDNYLIISSDTHAGLPDARYKEYLDPRYRDAFDEDLIQRAALRAPMNAQVAELEFVKDWYDENEEGLRGDGMLLVAMLNLTQTGWSVRSYSQMPTQCWEEHRPPSAPGSAQVESTTRRC